MKKGYVLVALVALCVGLLWGRLLATKVELRQVPEPAAAAASEPSPLVEEYSTTFRTQGTIGWPFSLTVIHDEKLGLTHTVLTKGDQAVALTTTPDALTALEMAIVVPPGLSEGIMPSEAELDAAIEAYYKAKQK